MKRLLTLAAVASLALSATAASAQDYHRGDYRHGDYRRNYPDYRAYERDTYRYRDTPHYDRHYYRGGYLPQGFRGGGYVINDYGRYGYAPPPYGYRYYRTDTGDIVMAAIATGLIASIILEATH